MAGATRNCCHLGAFCVHHTPCHFMQSHICKVYACLVVTCHLRFWQNDQGLLRATAVTRGWNGYRNKSQHRKSTPEKKIIPPLQQGFEPATFRSRVRRSNHWAIPAPKQSLVSGPTTIQTVWHSTTTPQGLVLDTQHPFNQTGQTRVKHISSKNFSKVCFTSATCHFTKLLKHLGVGYVKTNWEGKTSKGRIYCNR